MLIYLFLYALLGFSEHFRSNLSMDWFSSVLFGFVDAGGRRGRPVGGRKREEREGKWEQLR